MIKCSLIIPIYNKEHGIKETLDSIVKNHDIPDDEFECIIVDENSANNSRKICEAYSIVYSYIKYYEITNTNLSTALNFGKSIASGKYILFCEPGNILCQGFINSGCSFLDGNDEYSIYIGNYEYEDNLQYLSPFVNSFDVVGPMLPVCIFKSSSIKHNWFKNEQFEDIIYTQELILSELKYYFSEDNPIAYQRNSIIHKTISENAIIKNCQYSERYKYCLNDNNEKVLKEDKKIQNIEVYASHTCNLNCAYCCTFATLAKPQPPIPIDTIIDELKPLVHLRDDIKTLSILGGEPLLNPKLGSALYIIRKMFPNTELRIITNGTLYEKLYDLKDSIIDNNIMVIVSVYPVSYANKINDAFKYTIPPHLLLLNNNPITFGFYIKHLMEDTHNEIDKIKHCILRNHCTRLKGNRLYLCEYPANLSLLKEYFPDENINITEEGTYIEISDTTTADEIFKFCYNAIPDICYHCADVLQENLEINYKLWETRPWELTERKLEEFYIKSTN